MHTSGTLFVIIFEISKKNSNPVVKQHVFERFFNLKNRFPKRGIRGGGRMFCSLKTYFAIQMK